MTGTKSVKTRIEAFTQSRLSTGEGRLPETSSPQAHRPPKSLYSSSEAQLQSTVYSSPRHGAAPAHQEPVSPGPLRLVSNGRAAPTFPVDPPPTVATRCRPPALSPSRPPSLSLPLSCACALSLTPSSLFITCTRRQMQTSARTSIYFLSIHLLCMPYAVSLGPEPTARAIA